MLKKIREEVVTYYIDETGTTIKKVVESRLILELDQKERWETTTRSIPLI